MIFALLSLLTSLTPKLSAETLRITHLETESFMAASDDGLLHPTAVAVDPSGVLYISDTANHVIRKVTPDGAMSVFAGRIGEPGSADGPGHTARFDFPYGLAIDINGDLYVADSANSTIRRISPDGMVTTWAGRPGESGSGDTTPENPDGGRLGLPIGIALDPFGNLYVTDGRFHTIRKVDTQRHLTTIAGEPGVPGTSDGYGHRAHFTFPFGIARDQAGNFWVADSDNHTIRRIAPDGFVSTAFGDRNDRGSADGDAGTARFTRPSGLAFDPDGNLLVVDSDSHTIRQIDPEGEVTTLAGLAGQRGDRDGTGRAVRFNYPFGIAVAADGTIYVADMVNDAIRVGRKEEFGPSRRRAVHR